MTNESYSPQYWRILISLVFLIFISPLMDQQVIPYLIFSFSLLLIFGTVIAKLRKERVPRTLALLTGGIAFISSFVWTIPGITGEAVRFWLNISAVLYASFILVAIVSIGKSVFITDKITSDRIIGSVCVYILIGMFFACVYAATDLDEKPGFHIGNFYNDLYFSFSTLTTTGYGDIVPKRPIIKMFAVMEGIIGSMYLAIVVARLVGLHIAGKRLEK